MFILHAEFIHIELLQYQYYMGWHSTKILDPQIQFVEKKATALGLEIWKFSGVVELSVRERRSIVHGRCPHLVTKATFPYV